MSGPDTDELDALVDELADGADPEELEAWADSLHTIGLANAAAEDAQRAEREQCEPEDDRCSTVLAGEPVGPEAYEMPVAYEDEPEADDDEPDPPPRRAPHRESDDAEARAIEICADVLHAAIELLGMRRARPWEAPPRKQPPPMTPGQLLALRRKNMAKARRALAEKRARARGEAAHADG